MSEKPAKKILDGLVEASEWVKGKRGVRVTLPNGEVKEMTFDEYTKWQEALPAPLSIGRMANG